MESRNTEVSIFEYTNYRSYLRDLYQALKATKRHFSFRYFSRAAGFTSPNFLKLVMDGKRNLSLPSIEKFAKALRLNREESQFFKNLVQFNQATTAEERQQHSESLLKSRAFKKLHPLKPAQHAYYSSWHLVAIRELIDTRDFKDDPEWIAQTLSPPISCTEAAKALAILAELGMIQRDSTGKLIQASPLVSSGDEVTSSFAAQFHREMMKRASESIDRFRESERDISSISLSLSEEGMKEMKSMIQKFRKELLALAGQDKNQERVYQVNFQLFPLSEKKPENQS